MLAVIRFLSLESGATRRSGICSGPGSPTLPVPSTLGGAAYVHKFRIGTIIVLYQHDLPFARREATGRRVSHCAGERSGRNRLDRWIRVPPATRLTPQAIRWRRQHERTGGAAERAPGADAAYNQRNAYFSFHAVRMRRDSSGGQVVPKAREMPIVILAPLVAAWTLVHPGRAFSQDTTPVALAARFRRRRPSPSASSRSASSEAWRSSQGGQLPPDRTPTALDSRTSGPGEATGGSWSPSSAPMWSPIRCLLLHQRRGSGAIPRAAEE